MAGRITEIRVGIAVILAIILMIGGVTWLSEFRVSGKRVDYVVLFSDVGRLAIGDPVTVSGVQMGRVDDIELIRGGVAVVIALDRSVVVPVGSRVNVRNTGIIGEKFIAIDIVEAETAYVDGDTIVGIYESGVPEVISQMGEALTSLQRVSEQIDRILALTEDRGTVETTLRNVENASREISEAVRENRSDLRETAVNMREVSSVLRMMVDEKGPVVGRTIDRLSQTTGRIDTLVIKLDRLAGEVNQLTARLESVSTTVGKLMSDRELYDDFRGTLREVNLLMKDVRRNPRKYFNFSLF